MEMTATFSGRVAGELRAEMARRRIPARELARRVNRPANTVNRWVRGETPISLDDLELLCSALDVRAAELIQSAEGRRLIPGVASAQTRRALRAVTPCGRHAADKRRRRASRTSPALPRPVLADLLVAS